MVWVSKTDFKKLIENGALIIDVRSPAEFNSGHPKDAINIPLGSKESGISKIDKSKVIITCCASGIRSGRAKSILLANGFKQVYNAGSWQNVNL